MDQRADEPRKEPGVGTWTPFSLRTRDEMSQFLYYSCPNMQVVLNLAEGDANVQYRPKGRHVIGRRSTAIRGLHLDRLGQIVSLPNLLFSSSYT